MPALHVFAMDGTLLRIASVAYRGDSIADAHALGRQLLNRSR